MYPLLTVRETLQFAAELRIPNLHKVNSIPGGEGVGMWGGHTQLGNVNVVGVARLGTCKGGNRLYT